eukprot:275164_1
MSTTASNTDELSTKSQFIAEFQCESAADGIVHIKITNCDSLWDLNEYTTVGDESMELIYRSFPSPTVKNNNASIDKIWRVKDILLGSLGDDGDIYLRVPVYLHHYHFEFSLQTKNTSTGEWWPISPSQTIQIPSFLSENIYSVGDEVSFYNRLLCRISKGMIKDILTDGDHKILHSCYDKEWNESHEVLSTVPVSLISRKCIPSQSIVHISDDTQLLQHLLIQSDDTQHLLIFDAVKMHYSVPSQDYCFEAYGPHDFGVHWESMAEFVTKNICTYLFDAQFCYHVDCLQGNHGVTGVLQLSNLRVRDIKSDYEMLMAGVEHMSIALDSFDNIEYACNVCRCALREWDYVYSCCTKQWEENQQMHDYCLFCVHNVIQLNKELAQLLKDILRNTIDMDCIQTIVHYMIGRVIYMEFESNVEEVSCKKRTLESIECTPLPAAKRRKLN